MPDQGRTTTRPTARKVTAPVVDDAAPTDATGRTAEPARRTPDAPTPPQPSPRTGVLVNADNVRVAFVNGHASQAVGYLQHVLKARGLDPGEPTGIADHRTRQAVASLQSSISEQPTGLPTERTLDFLGFDVM
jgi:peptidoglycan hydrolase-like protein with peptidoglycan-binding domain